VSAGDFGGGGICEGVGSVLVSRSQVSYNHSVGMYSSGIVVALGSVTVTSGSRIDWNSNNGPGGGIAANFGGTVTVSGGSQVDHNTGSGNGGGIVNFAGPLGGVRVLGHSEVSHNVLTNYESLGQAIGVFLQVLANSLGVDFMSATGGTSPAAVAADVAQIEQEVASTASLGGSLEDPPGFVVSGGGIGTLLGGSITVAGGSHVDGNLSGFRVPAGNPNSIGIGGGLFSGLGPITVKGSTVDGNTALGSGGGIYNRGTLVLVDSTVTRNHATVRGGGITNRGQLTLVRTRVVANTPDNIAPPA
jgi:predicted outer membrane repeat protein